MVPRTILWLCIAAAAATGIAVELVIGNLGHGREAWDVSSYWTVGLPVLLAAALVFGFAARQAPVLIGYAPFAGQLAAMTAKTGGGSMIVPGILLLAGLGLGGVAAAYVGGVLARRLR
ncbi:MAG: hypothetical protein QM757_12270 [Paludibaculum sp.]